MHDRSTRESEFAFPPGVVQPRSDTQHDANTVIEANLEEDYFNRHGRDLDVGASPFEATVPHEALAGVGYATFWPRGIAAQLYWPSTLFIFMLRSSTAISNPS